ncbi:hypothetical protein POSPLADRAFT_1139039 [Postia placenta MAD-698-R-SB12]|uniref:Cyanovirin-N domain-containing protein n=1 Tax=Postia placenta MAD-698-R-SB12 TaxID=670580 RepID=A0A1X6N4K8_9APHY|nr:hypothetical protein POSPLADRAFT_1139039 [Postia placenta MAD-698-R-SB12]OSX63416.1 hypothetical protein POSPLADRAFT_1139039 [Postia placenta MAD-698-R-SB12]
MSPILRTAVVAIAVALYLPIVSANYADTCQDEYVTGIDLVATCTTDDGSQVSSTLNLDNCVANYDGDLNCVPNGGFSASCDVASCVLTGPEYLECYCDNGQGGQTASIVDLGPSCHICGGAFCSVVFLRALKPPYVLQMNLHVARTQVSEHFVLHFW